ncbi:MAG: hypothetical protein VKN33_09850 [Candidatus Sericytochromatia bacterium]|nr:hypothetical protein [Candidatus Sericytochromatia bacterium]
MSVNDATTIHRIGAYPTIRRAIDPPAPSNAWPAPALPSAPQAPQWPVARPPQVPSGVYPAYPVNPVPAQPVFPVPSAPVYPRSPGPVSPAYPVYPSRPPGGAGAFVRDVWTGVKERTYEIAQMVRHPFDARRRGVYRRPNPWAPRSTGETVGRWVINGALIVGAVFAGRALIGRFGGGGGAGVGLRGGLGSVVDFVLAPFRLLGRAVGAVASGVGQAVGTVVRGVGSVLSGIGNAIGGALSGLFGGAHVGFR